MDFPGFRIHNYIEEVEKFTNSFKQRLEEEKKEIENPMQPVTHLLNSFYMKESDGDSERTEPMRISLLKNSALFDTIFKEDTENAFLFSEDREEKKKRLAAERRAEYNAYLARKEQEFLKKRKVPEEMTATTTPRSILESVDYESILAKRKNEELKFRQLNYAEPNFNEGVNKHVPSVHQKQDIPEKILPSEFNRRLHSSGGDINVGEKRFVTPQSFSESVTSREISNRPLSTQELHIRRTGGGGEPVRDSFGNLITARGYKETAPILLLPSFKQDSPSNRQSSYREELARQIEEKKRLAALEKQKAQELEDRIAHRIEEQRRQMQLEYQNEIKVNNNVKEERQQERLRKLEEFQRKDDEMRQKLKESKVIETKQALSEITNDSAVKGRSSSPPVPAVRSKVIFEKATPPILSTAQTLTEVPLKPENIFSSLAEIRRKIKQDQHNFNREVKRSYEVMNRRTVPDVLADDEDDYDIQGVSEHLQSLKT